jgi:hypothetical protein
MALTLVEQNHLTTAEDQVMAGQECRLWYDNIRDSLLRAYPWSFATSRARLAASAAPQPFGFGRSFPFPSDCLAVRNCPDLSDTQWEVEGRAVVSDADAPLNVIYTRAVSEEGLFDPIFADALAHALARRIGPRLAGSSAAQLDRIADYMREIIVQAWAVDAIMGPTARFTDRSDDPWTGVLL